MKISGQYRAKCGDSPIWHETFGVIWLDTANKKIITYNPETTEERVYDALGWIKALIPTVDGQFIAVYKEGLYYLNFKLGQKKPFSFPPNLSEMHYLSDAKCGPDGQIWVGSADVFFQRFKETPHTAFSNYPFESAKLFSINAAGTVTEQLQAVSFSGGLEWDRKTNKFYHIDSSKQSIFQYQLTDNGQLQFEKLLYSFQAKEGFPKGLTIDGDGNLYVALYKGAVIAAQSEEPTRIVCLNPVTKHMMIDIQLPISHITSCTIGGKELNTLYVTTAYEPLAAYQIKEEPFAGYLLEIPLETTGVLPYEFESGLPAK
ncbi:MAG: SMP-30/gluconolactonase/LRE family protein [Solibacillus sp.]